MSKDNHDALSGHRLVIHASSISTSGVFFLSLYK